MRLWTWNDQGDRTEICEPFEPYIYIESNQFKDGLSLFNTPLRKLSFKNEWDRRRYVKDSGVQRIFYNLRPEQQFLIERFGGLQNDPGFSQYPLRVFFLDIETFSPYSFPVPAQAQHPINLITIFDTLEKKYHTFGLKEDFTPTEPNQTYYKCKSESEMLEKFLRYWENNYPDIVSGWNSEGFDIPYIINRITNVLGENEAKRLSPVGSLYYREDVRKAFGKDLGRWHIHGISCIDYMEAYKTFSRGEQESYSLNYIAHVELKEGKVAYNATNLAQLSEQDWNKFVIYNIQDVSLLIKLEDKLRYLKILRMIGYKGFTTFESSMGKISVVTGAIAQQALENGKIFPTFVKDQMNKYGGGFVKEIEPGLHENIITFDANSLYPNTLISLNLSLETKLGKVVNVDKQKNEVEVRLENGKTHLLTPEQFQQFTEKHKIAISRARILYSQKEKGVIPQYVDNLYAERVEVKTQMSALEQTNLKLRKNSKEYKANARQIEQLDTMQYTIKILLNSIYGVFGNMHSPFYDIDHAASITNTGQSVIKAANKIANEFVTKKYGCTEDVAVYNDTDSTHISLKPLLDKLGEPFLNSDGEINPLVYEKANELNDVINKGIDDWARSSLNSVDPRFYFKREAICAVGVYQPKKHYILHVRDKGESDPIPCDYIKYVGVEVVKSTMSENVKRLIKNVVESIIYTKERSATIDVYRQTYEDFKKLPVEDLAFRSKINNYEKSANKANKFAIGKGTPIHAKASIYYNLLLKHLNIETMYDPVVSGLKIKWFYTVPSNKFNIKCIAFTNEYPTEFNDIIKPDYELMFEKLVEPAITRFFECVKWRMVSMRNEYTCDLLDLLGI